MPKLRKPSIDSVTSSVGRRMVESSFVEGYWRGFKHGASLTFVLILVVTGMAWLSATAHAQEPSQKITIIDESNSGRLTLNVNGMHGWWWPRTIALSMLGEVESGRECKIKLVPTLEARIRVRDWQFARVRETTTQTTQLLNAQASLIEETLSDNGELRLALAKQQKRLGMGALIGAGATIVVGAVILGLTAAF